MKVWIIHQYESCAYGEYYGIVEVHAWKIIADEVARNLNEGDKDFDYQVEEQEVIDG